MKLRLEHFQDSSSILGPYLRSILWVQGCLKNCPHCIAPETHALTGPKVEIEDLAVRIRQHPENEGLTISGGEPFLQAQALCELLELLQDLHLGVIIYTGYTYEELLNKNNQYIHRLLHLTDLLIDGPYIKNLDQGERGRGSSNQRYIFFTERYQNCMDYFENQRQTIIYTDGNKYIMEGIPSQEDILLFDAITGD